MDLKELFNKLNLYETLGYFLVGSMFLTLMYFNNVLLKNIQFNLHDFKNEVLIPVLLLSYFFGHLIQAISNIIFDIISKFIPYLKEQNTFSEAEVSLLEEVRIHFNLASNIKDKTIWGNLMTYAKKNDYIGEVNRFNSYYSLYRGWAIVFFINSFLLSAQFMYLRWNWYSYKQFWFFLILNLIISIIFIKRSKRFWNYTKYKVFQSYKLNKIQ